MNLSFFENLIKSLARDKRLLFFLPNITRKAVFSNFLRGIYFFLNLDGRKMKYICINLRIKKGYYEMSILKVGLFLV